MNNENSAHSFTEGSDSGTLKFSNPLFEKKKDQGITLNHGVIDEFSNPVSPVKVEETKHTPDYISIKHPLPFVLGDVNQHVDRCLRDQGITMTKEISEAIMSFPKSPILDTFVEIRADLLKENQELKALIQEIENKWIRPDSYYWGSDANQKSENLLKKAQ